MISSLAFFFTPTAPTEIYTLSLHDALPISGDLGFWHTSIKLTSVANSTLLANLASLFVTLAAWIFLEQRPTKREADRKSTRLNSSHANISYAVFCLKKKN